MKSSQSDQRGLASIVVVSVITVVLALVTIGFARIMDRELRQALDRELSTQAFYAAESGLNDARRYVATLGSQVTNPNQCLPTTGAPFVPSISGSYSGSSTDNLVKYSCVLIDTQPKDLVYDVSAGQSVVFKITTSNPLQQLYFGWENKNYTPSANQQVSPQPLTASPDTLPQEDTLGPNTTGLLRVALYPISNNLGANANTTITNASRNYYLYPNASGTPHQLGTVGYGSNGSFANGDCNVTNRTDASWLPYAQAIPRYCNSAVNGLPGGINTYYVRATAYYADLSITVQAKDSSGSPASLSGAEALVDVTGEGNDILRRLQARAPLTPDYAYPIYSIQSIDTVCKRMRLPATGPGVYGPAYIDDGGTGDDSCDFTPPAAPSTPSYNITDCSQVLSMLQNGSVITSDSKGNMVAASPSGILVLGSGNVVILGDGTLLELVSGGISCNGAGVTISWNPNPRPQGSGLITNNGNTVTINPKNYVCIGNGTSVLDSAGGTIQAQSGGGCVVPP